MLEVETGHVGVRSIEVLDDRDVLLTRKEAAAYLKKSGPTLERWAAQGIGPKPIRVGPRSIRYTLRSLRETIGEHGGGRT
jgi:predicted DNA-binding transcriptional regulator AlpA